jgi:hypothetical protein
MAYRARRISLISIAVILSLGAQAPAKAQTASPQEPATNAVRSFYAFHLAHNKDFTVRNVQLRKRFLTAELYGLLLKELKRQAAESKAHPDEAPDFEGDPLYATAGDQVSGQGSRDRRMDVEGRRQRNDLSLSSAACQVARIVENNLRILLSSGFACQARFAPWRNQSEKEQ